MTSVRDVAQYILSITGKITTWKLQKLVYYSQAWHLVWDEEPLFDEEIKAWANGPVCPSFYQVHKGNFFISTVRGAAANRLSDSQLETIDIVVDHYGKYYGQQLSDLTHSEPPWQQARKGMLPRIRGNSIITLESMAEYYGSL
jgi:uncharacterized phage-associated protein